MIATKGQRVRLVANTIKDIDGSAIVKKFPYWGQPLGSRVVELDRQLWGCHFWAEQDLQPATKEDET